jgi:flavin reductase (DIM6/NTAB) family NADH-FMN oxidoreductase RutF
MANKVEPALTKTLFDFLQKEPFTLLSSIDYETGAPNISALSWVLARDNKTIVFAVDNRSRTVQNIKADSKVAINVIADESSFSISGVASVIQEKMEGVPLKLSLIELKISEVRDVMFYGSKMTGMPTYTKTYDLEAAKRLDQQVKEAMQKA